MARIHYPKENKPKRNKTWYKKNTERGLTVWQIVFRAFVVVSALVLCISYLSIFIDPAFMSVPSFFGLYYIPIFALNMVLIPFMGAAGAAMRAAQQTAAQAIRNFFIVCCLMI